MTRAARRQRQVDELLALCRSGRLGRAVDLAFEHAAGFGPDDVIVDALRAALDQHRAPPELQRRVRELARLGTDAGPQHPAPPD